MIIEKIRYQRCVVREIIERYRARMFNRKASDPKNRPDQILEVLKLQSGQRIADIGAGGGYFSLRFARAVGKEGLVYALDTNPEFLKFIKEQATENGYGNIETILVNEDELELPEGDLDMVFMRNVCNHLQDRAKYFANFRKMLRPSGRVAIIEYHPGGRYNSHRTFGHSIPWEVVEEEMRKSGYRLREFLNFLPEQWFTVYSIEHGRGHGK
jgi:arsenite methyltransferase